MDIRYFEWCFGFFRYFCDIYDRENVLFVIWIFKLNFELLINVFIYVIVFVFNNVGMSFNVIFKKLLVDMIFFVIIECFMFLVFDVFEENVNY